MNGIDVVKESREAFKDRNVPMPLYMILTAIEDSRLRVACLRDVQVDFFLTKPASTELLSKVLDAINTGDTKTA